MIKPRSRKEVVRLFSTKDDRATFSPFFLAQHDIDLYTQHATGDQLRDEFVTRPNLPMEIKISPLVGAIFSSNWVLFQAVYDKYEEMEGAWTHSGVSVGFRLCADSVK